MRRQASAVAAPATAPTPALSRSKTSVLQMPDRDGISVAAELSSVVPGCVAVIVTGHGRAGHLKRALEAGVRGFLPKTVSASVLGEVVRAVHRGGRYVDPELAAEAISAGDSLNRPGFSGGSVLPGGPR